MITKSGGSTLDASYLGDMGPKMFTKENIGLARDTVSLGSGVGLAALGVGFVVKKFINKIQNDTRRKAIIEDLMLTDPIIKGAPKEQVMAFYATINNMSPSIAIDKNMVKELLQHFVKFGTVDIGMIKILAETQSTIDKYRGWGLEKYLG